MTISYTGKFGRLLFRWKASLWKSVWKELVIFIILFYAITLLNRYGLDTEHKVHFSKIVMYLDHTVSGSIPIAFLLGLYVVTVTKRWWEQFENVAWPDNLLYLVSAFFRNNVAERFEDLTTQEDKLRFSEEDTRLRMIRRSIARYAVLASVLAWRNISSRVLKRFPTANHLTICGLMTNEEKEMYQNVHAPFGRWFMPINWIQTIIMQANREGRLDSSQTNQLLSALYIYKDKFVRLFVCDWVTIPLTYTQVCTVATYGYFAFCLVGRQDVADRGVTMYVPIFTILQFLFYMGWLKVGEHLIHPFGEEEDDFELNYIIDRHLFVGMMIVDGIDHQVPTLTRDKFWDGETWLPHTKASQRINEFKPHSHFGVASLPFQEMELSSGGNGSKWVPTCLRRRSSIQSRKNDP